MTRPDFATLEALPGNPDYRMVHGSWMNREEYDMCGWHVSGEYVENGKTQRYWRAELAGMQRYGALLRQRKAERREAWQEREAEEDEFTAYVNAIDDAKPSGNR